jgi:hypothetical protein
MSTTATPPRTRHHRRSPHGPRRAGETARSTVALRVRVARRGAALTSELAAGAPPGLSPELSLRATQLVSDRRRRRMARVWRRTLEEARRRPTTLANIPIIQRVAVTDAKDAITAVIAWLDKDEPVAVEGMAMLDVLLSDGASSPLYVPAEPGTLRRRILVATEALEPDLGESPLIA